MKKKIIKVLIVVIVVVIFSVFILIQKNNRLDTIKYNGKNYVLLEYNMDIFTYNHNSNHYYEVDMIHPVVHNKWDTIYFNGDLFIVDKQVKKATRYYSDDKNYDWYIVFDIEDNEVKKSISINNDELSYLYKMDKIERNETIVFEQIDMFADILKVSKDGLVQAVVTLAQVDNYWYYKTENMTEDDREYVIKITESLNEKINNLIEK